MFPLGQQSATTKQNPLLATIRDLWREIGSNVFTTTTAPPTGVFLLDPLCIYSDFRSSKPLGCGTHVTFFPNYYCLLHWRTLTALSRAPLSSGNDFCHFVSEIIGCNFLFLSPSCILDEVAAAQNLVVFAAPAALKSTWKKEALKNEDFMHFIVYVMQGGNAMYLHFVTQPLLTAPFQLKQYNRFFDPPLQDLMIIIIMILKGRAKRRKLVVFWHLSWLLEVHSKPAMIQLRKTCDDHGSRQLAL